MLVAAVALGLLFLLLIQTAVLDGWFTVIGEGHFIRIPNDDYAHLTYELAQLKRHPPQGTPVYVFGGSGAIEMFVSQKALAAAIAKAGGGTNVNVISLAAHQQTLGQTLALIDNLPPGKAVLLIGLAPSRLGSSPAADYALLSGRPMVLRSPRLEQLSQTLFGKKPPLGGIIPGIFDYLGNYPEAARRHRTVLGSQPPVRLPLLPRGRQRCSPARQAPEDLHGAQGGQVLLCPACGLQLRDAPPDRAPEQGARVPGGVLRPAAQHLGRRADLGGVLPAYQRRAEALANHFGVPYLHIERGIHLTDANFADLYHLLQSGRLKWQGELAKLVAPITRGVTAAPMRGTPSATPSPAGT